VFPFGNPIVAVEHTSRSGFTIFLPESFLLVSALIVLSDKSDAEPVKPANKRKNN
jgi:hypothetical protein